VPLILNSNELEIYSTKPSHNANKTLATALALSLKRPFFICDLSLLHRPIFFTSGPYALVGPCSTEKFDCKLKITSDQLWLDCCVQFKQSSYNNAAHHFGQLAWIRIASDQNPESNTNPSCILVLCKIQVRAKMHVLLNCGSIALLNWSECTEFFDDLKGHKEQRFPLHLDAKELEEDECHVVVSRRGRRGAIARS